MEAAPWKRNRQRPYIPGPAGDMFISDGKKSRGDSPCSFFDVDFIPGHGIVSGTPDYL